MRVHVQMCVRARFCVRLPPCVRVRATPAGRGGRDCWIALMSGSTLVVKVLKQPYASELHLSCKRINVAAQMWQSHAQMRQSHAQMWP